MATDSPRRQMELRYLKAAQTYLRKLPLEHFMEATAQAHQQAITLASLALVHDHRPEIQVFNELLVQYPVPRRRRPGQVVPDNMVVLHDQPIVAGGSYNLPFQPVGPFWMLEYVSRSTQRKDYDDNMRKYERELGVPYYMLFVPDVQELTLYRHTGQNYVSVAPNTTGHYALPELDLTLKIHAGWVRFWYQGEMLPLPADLQRTLDETRLQLERMTERAKADAQRADAEAERARVADLRAEAEAQKAMIAIQQAAAEAQRANAAANEIAHLRALLQQLQPQPPIQP